MRRPIIIAIIVFVALIVLALLYTLFTQRSATKVQTLDFNLVEESGFDNVQITPNGLLASRKNNIYRYNESSKQFDQIGSVKIGDVGISNDGKFISSGNNKETIIYDINIKQTKVLASDFFGWVGSGSNYVFTQPKPSTPGTDVIPDIKESILLGNAQSNSTTKIASTNMPFRVIASSDTQILLACGLDISTIVNRIDIAAKTVTQIESIINPSYIRTASPSLAASTNQSTTNSQVYLLSSDGKKTDTGIGALLSNLFVENDQSMLVAATTPKLTQVSKYPSGQQKPTLLYQINYVVPTLKSFVKYNNTLVFNSSQGVVVAQIAENSK